jgi:hypothetical protein
VTLGGGHFKTVELRTELESLRRDRQEFRALEAENRRLQAKQIAAEELARLRADHAALPRLRAEVEQLKNAAQKVSP